MMVCDAYAQIILRSPGPDSRENYTQPHPPPTRGLIKPKTNPPLRVLFPSSFRTLFLLFLSEDQILLRSSIDRTSAFHSVQTSLLGYRLHHYGGLLPTISNKSRLMDALDINTDFPSPSILAIFQSCPRERD